MLRKLVAAVERQTFGSSAFHVQLRATRALLKFHEDHKTTHGDLIHVRACLRALEAGEKTNARDAYSQIWRGKESLGDCWPDVTFPHEDRDYVWGVSEALFERWCRLMDSLAG